MLTPAYDQLTPVERVFVDGYVSGMEKAAKASGERLGVALTRALPSDHITASQGLLERPLVIAAVYAELRARSDQVDLSPERLINEYMSIAFSNMQDYIRVEYAVVGHSMEMTAPTLDLSNCTAEQWAAISDVNIDYHPNGAPKSVKIKLHNKMEALSKLGDYMAVLYRDNEYWKKQSASRNANELSHDIGVDPSNRYARMLAG